MRNYIAKRLVHAFVVVWIVATVVFGAVRAIPGDPVQLMLGGDATQEAREQLEAQLGLDQPIYVQYGRWMGRLAQGDFGESLSTGVPVFELLVQVGGPTVSIGLVGMSIALLIAVPAGLISAVHQYEWDDYIATFIAFLGISMPGFWAGILLIVLFAQHVEFIPAFGYVPLREGGLSEWFSHVLLPAIAVGIPYGGIIMRMMRSSMLEVLSEDYIRTARAKGLSPKLIVFKHAFQNALIPVVTIGGILLGTLLGGVVAVELVFGIQGLGRLLIGSIHQRDFPVIQGSIVLIAFVFVMANLVIDILYTMINPQIKYGGGQES